MGTSEYDPPDSPRSVGWTRPQTACIATAANPFTLESGETLGPVDVEYETYGALSAAKDNAILVFHALSGDAHVAGWDAAAKTMNRPWRERKPGWWDAVIGPGKAIDTRRWCVICANVIGSCYGSTGPVSVNPATGKPYALSFPGVTVSDWTKMCAGLLDHLGIDCVQTALGGSLGGQQALEFSLRFPDRARRVIILASAPRLSTQGLAFNAVGRHAILTDPHYNNGEYYDGTPPADGLAAARMLAHITYLSDEGMFEKFGRRLQSKAAPDFDFGIEFEVESYLAYQGRSFVERFDANSYLYITRAMDYYDAAALWGDGNLVEACRRITAEVTVASFSSDWLYSPAESRAFAMALSRAGKAVTYVEVPSKYGHDAFLVEEAPVGRLLCSVINR